MRTRSGKKLSKVELEVNTPPGRRGRRGALQVYDKMRDDILWLRLEPGSAIDEVALAARFEVSRTPVREALLMLAGDGLVQFLPNRTTIVAPLLLNNTGDYLDVALVLSRSVARSAALSGKADRKYLNALVERYERAIGSAEALIRASNAFQRHLASLSGNIFLIKYFDQILDAGVRARVLHFFPNASQEELLATVDLVKRLADAVVAGDVEASDRAMTETISNDAAIIARSLYPKFGTDIDLSPTVEVGKL
jgi:DNA-binding GntR family transcriptional regulator